MHVRVFGIGNVKANARPQHKWVRFPVEYGLKVYEILGFHSSYEHLSGSMPVFVIKGVSCTWQAYMLTGLRIVFFLSCASSSD